MRNYNSFDNLFCLIIGVILILFLFQKFSFFSFQQEKIIEIVETSKKSIINKIIIKELIKDNDD
ncbi:hypothetical protein C6B37_02615 [Candidatus Phytoplasma phoenicium]|uniref:Uncharacterized protein n=1 Tax=Candidatus Phytoplasma phoenicium TaxID=198422 RepID=A0A2S8NT30_9MOLU|nr:hypothetical protein C6B37_02615 [Candidatus Phytoplasma phoenicium]